MAYDVPILVIIFNRPVLTQKLFDALKILEPRHLYIASDSPRETHADDIVQCQMSRDIFENIDWVCSIKKKYNITNLGCDTSIREALSWFFGEVQYGIVLEDDCIPNQSFFNYCSVVLERHKDDKDIAIVCGTNHYDNIISKNTDYFTSNLMYTWGWASWSRFVMQIKWNTKITEMEAQDLLNQHFDNKEYVHFYKNIINYFISQPIKTKPWDIEFFIFILRNNLLTLIPSRNMIKNLGYTGEHFSTTKKNKLFNNITYEYPQKTFSNFTTLSKVNKKKLITSFILKANSHTFRDKLYLLKQRIKKILTQAHGIS